MDTEKITIAGEDFYLLFADLLKPLEANEFDALREDISVNGIVIPVITDGFRGVIDGAHRLRIAAELKMKNIPIVVMHHLSDERKKEYAIRLNTARRQLKEDDKLSIAVSMREDGLSLRKIASVLGVHHETVRRHLNESDVEYDQPEAIVGIDGRQRKLRPQVDPSVFAKDLTEANSVYDICAKSDLPEEVCPKKLIDVRRFRFITRMSDYKKLALTECDDDYTDADLELFCSDFRDMLDQIDDDSVDMIFTDPPYDFQGLKLWEDLADMASKKLKPGGILASYSGSTYLPKVFEILSNKLTYVWTAAIYHKSSKNIVYKVNAKSCWKPILIYCKPTFNKYWGAFFDMYSGGQEKQHHLWEQPVAEAAYYIEKFCPNNGTLLDPMMGSGTSIIATLQIKKKIKAMGIDMDRSAYVTALNRVEEYRKMVAG